MLGAKAMADRLAAIVESDEPGVGWPGFLDCDPDEVDDGGGEGNHDEAKSDDGAESDNESDDDGDNSDWEYEPEEVREDAWGAIAKEDQAEYQKMIPHGTRERPYKQPFPQPITDGLARLKEAGIPEVVTKPFGNGRKFESSQAFLSEWAKHEQDTFTCYQSRNSQSVQDANEKREAAHKGPPDELFKSQSYPDSLGHVRIVRRCRHGIIRPSRGKGIRQTKTSNFIECRARLTLSAKFNVEENKWELVTRNENNVHNHKCNQAVLDTLGKSALLSNPAVVTEVHRMMQARAPARNICDTIAANFGIVITPKQLANLKRDRLGGLSASANLKLLLQRFATFEGSRTLIVDDQHRQVCGVVLQSAAQQAMFEMYGDNLILDWTHNTNNMGFYLGSFMVTSVTGRGVSVCDFLCLEQTEAMMTSVFQHFIKTNRRAAKRVKSFIIDKDYKEWRVLERLFKKAVVLLCQFHVVKWFVYVVTKKKYNLSLEDRDKVLDIVYAMVYTATVERFEMLRHNLDVLLKETSPTFLRYMEVRWYGCRRMWSTCERATVFTALNTTSNRIESSWNQVKKVLGKKLRIDLCVESVFSYQTAVFRREIAMINKYASKLILRSECNPFIRSAMAEVCEYAAEAVVEQWTAFEHVETNEAERYVSSCDPSQPHVHTVVRPKAESCSYSVNARSWRCSCHFNITSALPCRHMMFVAKRVLNLSELPIDSVPRRWNLKEAACLLPVLTRNTPEIQSLRTGLLLSDAAFSELIEPDFFEVAGDATSVPRRVTYFRLKRKEVSEVVVLNNLEKRGIIEAEVAAVTRYLMSQSTPQFMKMATDLRELLSDQMKKWQDQKPGQSRKAATKAEDDALATALPQHECISEMNDMDAVIASAMADEEKAYADADISQRLRLLERRLGEEDSNDKIPSSSVRAKSIHQRPDPADTVKTHEITETIDAILHNDGDISSPWSGVQFDEIPFPGDPPLETPAFNQWPIVTSAPSSVPPAVMLEVAQQQLNEDTTSMTSGFLSTSSLSDIMLEVASHNLHVEPPKGAARLSKRRATEKEEGLSSIKSLIADETEDGENKRIFHSTLPVATSRSKKQQKMKRKLPLTISAGITKKQGSTGPPTGVRLGYVDQSSLCPVQLRECVSAFTSTRVIYSVLPLWSKVPLRLHEQLVDKMETYAEFKTIPPNAQSLNFRIPVELTEKLILSVKNARRFGGTRAGTLSKMVDLTTTSCSGYVASVNKALRGFTEENLVDLKEFYNVYNKCDSYRLDLDWLRTDSDAKLPLIPYMLTAVQLHRPTSHQGDISQGARDSIRDLLLDCSLKTTFSTRTQQPELQMKITLEEIFGFLPRSSKLNDSVMMFALRQMATDFDDIHVFECMTTVLLTIPTRSLHSFRWVMFPRYISKCHWCMIFCKINASGVCEVAIYDPMQGGFMDSTAKDWKTTCRPVLQHWVDRDYVQGTVVREEYDAVVLQGQHDSSSCGVYCLAAALDRMQGDYYFQERGSVGASAACQLRMRCLWRILFDTNRHEGSPPTEQDRETLEKLHDYEEEKTKRKRLK